MGADFCSSAMSSSGSWLPSISTMMSRPLLAWVRMRRSSSQRRGAPPVEDPAGRRDQVAATVQGWLMPVPEVPHGANNELVTADQLPLAETIADQGIVPGGALFDERLDDQQRRIGRALRRGRTPAD